MLVRSAIVATGLAIAAVAQASVEWRWTSRYFGAGPSGCVGQVITSDSAGSSYIAGFSSGGVSMVKYDALGAQMWTALYPTPSGWANGIALDQTGNVVLCGTAMGSGSGMDIFVAKFSAQGKKVWTRRFNGPTNQNDYATGMGMDIKDDIYIAGTLANATAVSDVALLKFDKHGGTVWTRTYNGPANGAETAKGIAVCPDGVAFMVGSTSESDGGTSALGLRYTDSGALTVLDLQRPDHVTSAYACAVDGQGNLVVASAFGPTNTSKDLLTQCFDHGGSGLWRDPYAGPGGGNDEPVAVAFDTQGNCVLTGVTGQDMITLSYAASGNRNWETPFVSPGLDNPTSIAMDAAGNAYVAGFTPGSDGTSDYLVVKYSTSGVQEWAMTYGGVYAGEDQAFGLALDNWGNALLVGGCFDPSNPFLYECATVKFVQPLELQPQAITLLRGVPMTGGLAEVLFLDGQRLVFQPGSVFSSADWPGQIAFTTIAPDTTATELRLEVVASASSSVVLQNTDFYDFTSSSWRNQDARNATTTDTLVRVSNSTNLARFYEPGTRMLKARLRFRAGGLIFVYPWSARIDYLRWSIVH